MFTSKRIIIVAALAALVTASFGQGFRGGFGRGPQTGAMLLRRDDVKNDLKLTDDQKTKLLDLQDKMQSKMREIFQGAGGDREKMQADMKSAMEEATKDVNAVLTPDQQTRLKQIGIQLAGNGAAALPEVQADLKLTDEQKSKVADLQKTSQEANQSVMEKVRSQEIDRDAAGAAFKKNTDALNEEIGKILTDAQKAKLKELGGPVFTPDPPSGGGR
jgi:Spy/CpxP family protein refolding chaperone